MPPAKDCCVTADLGQRFLITNNDKQNLGSKTFPWHLRLTWKGRYFVQTHKYSSSCHRAGFVTSHCMSDWKGRKTQLEMDYKEQVERNAKTNHTGKTTLEQTQIFSSLQKHFMLTWRGIYSFINAGFFFFLCHLCRTQHRQIKALSVTSLLSVLYKGVGHTLMGTFLWQTGVNNGHFFPLACRRMLVNLTDFIMFAYLQLWL